MAAISGGKTYHHGDLRNALICAAVDLATEGGPERVVLREAARRVGVSPTAAYRHFDGRGELLRTVRTHAQRLLADAMERAAAREPGADDPDLAAERRVAALCRGYVGFAVDQPGLYRAAFCAPRPAAPDEAGAGAAGPRPRAPRVHPDPRGPRGPRPHRNPRLGVRPASGAAAWSAVHGLSLLLLEGPLRRLSAQRRDAVVDTTLAMVVSGTRTP